MQSRDHSCNYKKHCHDLDVGYYFT